jgi:hypothetical protein
MQAAYLCLNRLPTNVMAENGGETNCTSMPRSAGIGPTLRTGPIAFRTLFFENPGVLHPSMKCTCSGETPSISP